MKIESLIRRNGGSFVELPAPETQYHFKPSDTDPRHIAEVEPKSHIAMLLRITNGFKAVDAEEDELPPLPKLNSSLIHNASYPVHIGDDIELDDLVTMAFEHSALKFEEWNALEDEQRYEYIDNTLADLQYDPSKVVVEEVKPTPVTPIELQATDITVNLLKGDATDQPQTAPPADPVPPIAPVAEPKPAESTMTRVELEAAYLAKFGRKCSNLMKDENIAKAISEGDDE